MKAIRIVAVALSAAWGWSTAALLAGCSSQQLHDAGRSWQENQCDRTVDRAERDRCLARARSSGGDYRRESETAR